MGFKQDKNIRVITP